MLSNLCRPFQLSYPRIIDTNRMKKFAYNFVNMLKSINMSKILCIFIIIPTLNIRIKYFKIRYKVLHDAYVVPLLPHSTFFVNSYAYQKFGSE